MKFFASMLKSFKKLNLNKPQLYLLLIFVLLLPVLTFAAVMVQVRTRGRAGTFFRPCPNYNCQLLENCPEADRLPEYGCPYGFLCCKEEEDGGWLTPSPTPIAITIPGCFEPCPFHGSDVCQGNLECIGVGGQTLCRNSCCTSEETCDCSNYGGCYQEPRSDYPGCDLPRCNEGLVEYTPSGSPGVHYCVNPECIDETDCVCAGPTESPTPSPTSAPKGCNEFCQENEQCLSNYCHITSTRDDWKRFGYCRNSDCPQKTDCDCTPGTCTLSCTPQGYTYQVICRASSALPPGGRYLRSCSYSWGDGTTTNARSTACESAFNIYRQRGTYTITYKDNYNNATCSDSVRVGAP